jgi:ferrochelatase
VSIVHGVTLRDDWPRVGSMRDGVLLIGHGSVESEADIPEFVRNIRRGRPTPQSVIDEVTHRWRAIGGSPLLQITHAQAEALSKRLGLEVAVGMRLFRPWAKDAVAELAKHGVERVISLPLAPYSVHVYHATAREACAAAGVSCIEVPPWGEEPALLDAFAASIRRSLDALPEGRGQGAHVLLTAHSLPTRVVQAGDQYEAQVRATAAGVMRSLASAQTRFHVAYQSQGMDGGEWLGPDLRAAFDTIAAEGARDVVVCAIGFLADHTEVLFDLDIEARAWASERGLTLSRAESLNASPRFIDALENVARRALRT